MKLIISLILVSWSCLVASQTPKPDSIESAADSHQEWVLVFDDPRPLRLQGWSKSGYGKHSGDYKGALELKRFSKKVASKYDMNLHDQWFIPTLGVYCLVVSFNLDQSVTMRQLKQDKTFQWIQESNEFELLNDHRIKHNNVNDHATDHTAQRNFESTHVKHTTDALPTQIDGRGVVIAIVDSGVDNLHKDLEGSINKIEDFVIAADSNTTSGESHGTAIAGVMITDQDTKLGVAGISPAAQVNVYRGCWESVSLNKTNCNTLSLARALDAVARGNVDILNLSLSGPKDALLDRILQRIIDNGAMVIAAFDPKRSNAERFPIERDGVLIVRAEGLDRNHSQVFSAPGARIVAKPGNQYDFMHGHSVATAYTSGLFALRKQAFSSGQVKKSKLDWRHTRSIKLAKDVVMEVLQES